MVNYGVSRACAMCKKRHKRCDEARPSCKRCMKTGFTCPGYQDEVDLIFRRSRGIKKDSVSYSKFGKQTAKLGTRVPNGSFTAPANDSELARIALGVFLEDYCLSSKDTSLSRGYLDNLKSLLARSRSSSDLAKAAKLAAFANLGNKHHQPILVQGAKLLHLDLLDSFRRTMSNPATSHTIESLTTAVLLGLYEIISATRKHPGEHGAHVRGVAAILSSEDCVFNRHPAKQFLGSTDPSPLESPSKGILMWPHDLNILSPPTASPEVTGLDDLLLRFSPIFRKCQLFESELSLSINEVREFRDSVLAVDKEFSMWPARQAPGWMPRMIGFTANGGTFQDGIFLPHRVETYFDVYVSAVWNSYRKCRLLLLNYIYTCSKRIHDNDPNDSTFLTSRDYILKETQDLSESIAASMPFHLLRNPECLLNGPQTSSAVREMPIPNASIGGLLIMYVINVVSKLPIVPENLRAMFKGNLEWIGRVMGVGQATLLADPWCLFPKEFMMDGHVLVWAGTLILQKQGEEDRDKLKWALRDRNEA